MEPIALVRPPARGLSVGGEHLLKKWPLGCRFEIGRTLQGQKSRRCNGLVKRQGFQRMHVVGTPALGPNADEVMGFSGWGGQFDRIHRFLQSMGFAGLIVAWNAGHSRSEVPPVENSRRISPL